MRLPHSRPYCQALAVVLQSLHAAWIRDRRRLLAHPPGDPAVVHVTCAPLVLGKEGRHEVRAEVALRRDQGAAGVREHFDGLRLSAEFRTDALGDAVDEDAAVFVYPDHVIFGLTGVRAGEPGGVRHGRGRVWDRLGRGFETGQVAQDAGVDLAPDIAHVPAVG